MLLEFDLMDLFDPDNHTTIENNQQDYIKVLINMLKNLNTIKKQNEQDAEDDLNYTIKFLSEL